MTKRLPTFTEMVKYYGPYMALLLSLVAAFLIMQFVWFKKTLAAKNELIKRLAEREKELNDRVLHLIDKKITYKR